MRRALKNSDESSGQLSLSGLIPLTDSNALWDVSQKERKLWKRRSRQMAMLRRKERSAPGLQLSSPHLIPIQGESGKGD